MTTLKITKKIETFLNQFPNDAKSWNAATDEVRDLARGAKQFYNELDLDLLEEEVEAGQGQQPLDFRAFKTPAEWNTKGKAYIMEVWTKMSEATKEDFFKSYAELINQA